MAANGTVPIAADHPEVLAFLQLQRLSGPAVYVDYAEHGYGPDWCHVSAKHRAMEDGGRRVHGWALWAFGDVIFGDHHSIWQTPQGELVDVTPPKYGAGHVLFVRDDSAIIESDDKNFYLLTNRSSVQDAKCVWQGNPSDYTHWPCPQTKSDLVAYCAALDFPPSAIVTDQQFG
jgi:hypothetical protein